MKGKLSLVIPILNEEKNITTLNQKNYSKFKKNKI